MDVVKPTLGFTHGYLAAGREKTVLRWFNTNWNLLCLLVVVYGAHPGLFLAVRKGDAVLGTCRIH